MEVLPPQQIQAFITCRAASAEVAEAVALTHHAVRGRSTSSVSLDTRFHLVPLSGRHLGRVYSAGGGNVYVHSETGHQITIDAVGIGGEVARPYLERARDLDVIVNTVRQAGLFERQVVNLQPGKEDADVAAYLERRWSMPNADLHPWQRAERWHSRVQVTQVHFVTLEELRTNYERVVPTEIPLSWEAAYLQLTSFADGIPRRAEWAGEYLSSAKEKLRAHVAASQSQLARFIERIAM